MVEVDGYQSKILCAREVKCALLSEDRHLDISVFAFYLQSVSVVHMKG